MKLNKTNMNAEKLLKYLKKCVEDLNIKKFDVIISPTMYDPNELQNDVSFFVMEKIKEGSIPRFTINVKDADEHSFNQGKVVPTYVPAKWYNIIDNDLAIQNITKQLDALGQNNGMNEDNIAPNPSNILLSSKFKSAISEVDPDLSIHDLANAVTDIVIDDYGSHNYEPFTTIINQKLGKLGQNMPNS